MAVMATRLRLWPLRNFVNWRERRTRTPSPGATGPGSDWRPSSARPRAPWGRTDPRRGPARQGADQQRERQTELDGAEEDVAQGGGADVEGRHDAARAHVHAQEQLAVQARARGPLRRAGGRQQRAEPAVGLDNALVQVKSKVAGEVRTSTVRGRAAV